MRKLIQALALGVALAVAPACAALKAPAFENPVAAAQTADQKAYALLAAYAAVLEEATDVVRDPATPTAFKQMLVRAERVATPAWPKWLRSDARAAQTSTRSPRR